MDEQERGRFVYDPEIEKEEREAAEAAYLRHEAKRGERIEGLLEAILAAIGRLR